MSASTRWVSRSRTTHIIGGVLLILLGLAVTPLFWERPYRKLQARNWTAERGVIAGAKDYRSGGGKGALLLGRQVEVRFFYHVGAPRFDATQVIGRSMAENLGVRIPNDGGLTELRQPAIRVACYYDPAHPAHPVITRDFDRTDLAVIFPLVFIGLGIGLVVKGRRVARDSTSPLGRLKNRNHVEWDVAPAGTGATCVPTNHAAKLTLARLADVARGGEPYNGIELLDYPLRLDRPNRLRVHRAPGREPRKVIVHLEAVPRNRSFAGLRGSGGRSIEAAVSFGTEDADHVFAFDVPEGLISPGDDLRLRVTLEAGLVGATPRFLYVELAADDEPVAATIPN